MKGFIAIAKFELCVFAGSEREQRRCYLHCQDTTQSAAPAPSHSIRYEIFPSGVTRFPITRKPSPDSILHSVLKKLRSGTIEERQKRRLEPSLHVSSVGFENTSELIKNFQIKFNCKLSTTFVTIVKGVAHGKGDKCGCTYWRLCDRCTHNYPIFCISTSETLLVQLSIEMSTLLTSQRSRASSSIVFSSLFRYFSSLQLCVTTVQT